jgi:biotin transport system substrate-specific component
MTTNTNLLADRLWPVARGQGLGRAAVLAVLGSLVVAAAAQISVPMIPVPMTLQTLAVLMVGAAYGARLGATTLALYALEGAAGLPVFANFQAGLFLPTGEIIATGGYILGFILAAGVVGYLAEKGWTRSIVRLCAATLIGAAVLYVPGLVWLAVWLAQVKGMAAEGAMAVALSTGLLPFIPGDIVKAVLAGLATSAAASLTGER